jgi:hypothetical protein
MKIPQIADITKAVCVKGYPIVSPKGDIAIYVVKKLPIDQINPVEIPV